MIDEIEHSFVEIGDLRIHLAEQGEGPLVLLLHGFPECWYSWRHQFQPLAAAGYRVVAPDQRGYARSDQPAEIEEYSLLHLAGDVIGLIHALGTEQAVVVGHDWGAIVAWTVAMLRPDVVRAVAGLSVPPHLPGGCVPLATSRKRFGDKYYQVYFQQPGIADAELVQDPSASFRYILTGASGESEPRTWIVPAEGLIDPAAHAIPLPGWLSEDDIGVYVREFDRHGDRAFTGALNWYRNIDRNWKLLSAFHGRRIEVPALYVGGTRDSALSARGADQVLSDLEQDAPQLYSTVLLQDCGHWTQQERPDDVTTVLLRFLAHVGDSTAEHPANPLR
ncbi:alpha/beta fold hydrolase [Nocardia brasiliensis]|uniref:Epoxide hydrolase n=1 Tax=Nocardia brasiliensis (strain ATCC 700358 / HUJEG-1) TaxID=1133849 RepID=K0F524_NOCB7|nr:alpha/beta hydrolase [Nocardia brasiliensis]AFU04709.1 epoxide hydrolase [Nocardia brasiliensis ATCC 700358]OCF88313.1 epoxide hydrolase [Nocardia brasiliensis]